jgi:hypothetical protein
VPVVRIVPIRPVDHRVETDPVNRYSGLERRANLGHDLPDPRGAPTAEVTRFSKHEWSPEASPHPAQELMQRYPPLIAGVILPPQPLTSELPLIRVIVVEAENVEIAGITAQRRLERSTQELQRLELRPGRCAGGGGEFGTADRGDDVNQRINLKETGVGHDVSNRLDPGDRRPNELTLDLRCGDTGERMHDPPGAGGPGHEGDLVDGREAQRMCAALIGEIPGGRAGIGGEPIDEPGVEELEAVWPAIVTQGPDHLHVLAECSLGERPYRGEVVAPAPVHEVPAHRLAYRADVELLQPPIVFRRQTVVLCGREQVEAHARAIDVAGGLESRLPEAAERCRTRRAGDRHGCRPPGTPMFPTADSGSRT